MTNMRIGRFIAKIVLAILLSIYVLYNYQSVPVFIKSVTFWTKGHGGASAVADMLLSSKFPYSPLSPVSKFMLGIKTATGDVSQDNIWTKPRPLINIGLTRTWNPVYVDGFSLMCILFTLVYGTLFRALHENPEKRGYWKYLGIMAVVLTGYCVWAVVVVGKIPGSTTRVPMFVVGLGSIAWGIYGFVLIKKTFSAIRESNLSIEECDSNVLVVGKNRKPTRLQFAYYTAAFAATVTIILGINNISIMDFTGINDAKKAIARFAGPADVSQKSVYRINVDGLNMRKGPGTGHEVITVLKPEDRLNVIGKDGGWFKIKVNGQVGWVHGRYISKI